MLRKANFAAYALGAFFGLALLASAAEAQTNGALVTTTCGTLPSGVTYSSGQTRTPTQDVNGNGCIGGGGTGAPTSITPVATATNSGITVVNSSALESNHVLKNSPGNLYSVYITTGATAGYLLTYNGTTAPTAGGAAIAPVDCVYAPANTTIGLAMAGDPPDPYSTGIVAVFSTSGCLTNTASNTVFFKGRVK